MRKVVILHTDVAPDAGEDEQDTLRQAQIVFQTVISLGYKPVMLPFVLDLNTTIEKLRALQPDIVFNLVETLAGRGNMIYFATALLDYLRLPYTGCRTDAIFLTSNKPLAKKMMHAGGIATPSWLTADGIVTGKASSDTYILKASWEDASVGLEDASIFQTSSQNMLLEVLRKRRQTLGLDCFAEAYVDGREFNIALLAAAQGVRMLPPAEMLFHNYPSDKLKILDYRSKWAVDSFEYQNTRRTFDVLPQDGELLNQLRAISRTCWDLFGLRGYARVDFRVDHQGNPFVLEINANPCLSPDAGFAAALEKAGMTYPEAIDHILRDALTPED